MLDFFHCNPSDFVTSISFSCLLAMIDFSKINSNQQTVVSTIRYICWLFSNIHLLRLHFVGMFVPCFFFNNPCLSELYDSERKLLQNCTIILSLKGHSRIINRCKEPSLSQCLQLKFNDLPLSKETSSWKIHIVFKIGVSRESHWEFFPN